MTKNKEKNITKQAPDGGWGWFVCLGSSLITVNNIIIAYVYGIEIIYNSI